MVVLSRAGMGKGGGVIINFLKLPQHGENSVDF